MTPQLKQEILAAANKRRTFAIISHPDAGKTTLTEKLLLYSGMVRTAGMVGARKNAKLATSDWMEMEQERGISITASAMRRAWLALPTLCKATKAALGAAGVEAPSRRRRS